MTLTGFTSINDNLPPEGVELRVIVADQLESIFIYSWFDLAWHWRTESSGWVEDANSFIISHWKIRNPWQERILEIRDMLRRLGERSSYHFISFELLSDPPVVRNIALGNTKKPWNALREKIIKLHEELTDKVGELE